MNYVVMVRNGLGTTGMTRAKNFPALPTVHETILSGYESGNWMAIFAPAGIDPAIRCWAVPPANWRRSSATNRP